LVRSGSQRANRGSSFAPHRVASGSGGEKSTIEDIDWVHLRLISNWMIKHIRNPWLELHALTVETALHRLSA